MVVTLTFHTLPVPLTLYPLPLNPPPTAPPLNPPPTAPPLICATHDLSKALFINQPIQLVVRRLYLQCNTKHNEERMILTLTEPMQPIGSQDVMDYTCTVTY